MGESSETTPPPPGAAAVGSVVEIAVAVHGQGGGAQKTYS
jgi:hypothetical protein